MSLLSWSKRYTTIRRISCSLPLTTSWLFRSQTSIPSFWSQWATITYERSTSNGWYATNLVI